MHYCTATHSRALGAELQRDSFLSFIHRGKLPLGCGHCAPRSAPSPTLVQVRLHEPLVREIVPQASWCHVLQPDASFSIAPQRHASPQPWVDPQPSAGGALHEQARVTDCTLHRRAHTEIAAASIDQLRGCSAAHASAHAPMLLLSLLLQAAFRWRRHRQSCGPR